MQIFGDAHGLKVYKRVNACTVLCHREVLLSGGCRSTREEAKWRHWQWQQRQQRQKPYGIHLIQLSRQVENGSCPFEAKRRFFFASMHSGLSPRCWLLFYCRCLCAQGTLPIRTPSLIVKINKAINSLVSVYCKLKKTSSENTPGPGLAGWLFASAAIIAIVLLPKCHWNFM